jgi:hypothetical protein
MALRRAQLRLLLVGVGLLIVALAPGATTSAGAAPTGLTAFCSRVAKTNVGPFPANPLFVSSGAMMVCFGPQASQGGVALSTGSAPTSTRASTSSTTTSPGTSSGSTKNVDAANTSEDITSGGTRAYGQSEESIAASGPFVVDAWNDATGFFEGTCGPPMYKEELTGLGFSSDGGKSFTDLGGLPNNDCNSRYEGDPSVEAYQVGGSTYFYISSLYINFATGESDIAMDACQASGATLACNSQPTIVAKGVPGCDFLDKDFASIDQQRGFYYNAYVRFSGCDPTAFNGRVELAKCDLSSPLTPVCNLSPAVVSTGDANCEQEGPYPAVDEGTGDVYVAWEFNWASNFSIGACATQPVQDRIRQMVGGTVAANQNQVNIVSMDTAFVPGYNRFPMNDFPRISASEPYGTVSIVWNDARNRVLGDIFMQSYALGTLTPVQPAPVPLDSLSKGGAYFLPALRNPTASGKLNVSFFYRAGPNTTLTDTYANTGITPTDPNPAQTNTRVTNVTSDWNAVSSDIIPNFGDYTDNYVAAAATPPTYTGKTLYVTWADGRLGVPNPFVATFSSP